MMNGSRIVVVALTLWCAVLLGGQRSNAAVGEAAASAANRKATKVTRIVFVGKENACACTRRAIDGGWAALQKALGTPPKVPVERLQIDTEAAKVAPYQKQKPMMALPAIYFLDG